MMDPVLRFLLFPLLMTRPLLLVLTHSLPRRHWRLLVSRASSSSPTHPVHPYPTLQSSLPIDGIEKAVTQANYSLLHTD